MSILVVGSVALDSIETPRGKVEMTLGGSATYFSTAASLFSPVKLVAVVGDDFPQAHIDFLKARGVDLEGLEVKSGKTFHWSGRYADDFGDVQTLGTDLNVYAEFRPNLPQKYKNTPYLFLANISPELQLEVLNQIKRPKIVASDTIKLWIQTCREPLLEVIEASDVFFTNESEAKLLTDETNLIKAAEKILEVGCQRVVVKKGEHGAFSISQNDYFCAPAYPLREIADPTGAGDSFAGGFIGYLASIPNPADNLSELHMRQALIYGSAVASFNVEGLGLSRLSVITRVEVERRVEELREMSKF
jgi:sugar/nucleoside kinase (ribokinase family)